MARPMDDLTEWADAEIHKLDAGGWRGIRRFVDSWNDVGGGLGWLRLHYYGWIGARRVGIAEARALLAARDRVLAGLTVHMRRMLLQGDPYPPEQGGVAWVRTKSALVRRGLFTEWSHDVEDGDWRTDLGHECAAELRSRGHATMPGQPTRLGRPPLPPHRTPVRITVMVPHWLRELLVEEGGASATARIVLEKWGRSLGGDPDLQE